MKEIEPVHFWVIVIIVCITGAFLTTKPEVNTPDPSPPTPVEECQIAAMAEYNNLSMGLNEKEMDALVAGQSTVNYVLAARRLEEEYCDKSATCEFLGTNPHKNPVLFSSNFSSCITDEENERASHRETNESNEGY